MDNEVHGSLASLAKDDEATGRVGQIMYLESDLEP